MTIDTRTPSRSRTTWKIGFLGPLHQQQGSVVAQAAAALMVEHRPHQAAQQFFGGPATGGFPLQQIDQPVQAELLPDTQAPS